MPKRKILPTIDAVYGEDGIAFTCDGEPIEDMEFSWEDLSDPELVTEVAEELVEYIDSDELEDIDHPVKTVCRVVRQLLKSKSARKADEEDEEDEDEDELESSDDDEMD